MTGPAKPRVLVIGAGFAGGNLAVNIASFADVTLVDKNDYFEVAFANARTMVEPASVAKTMTSIQSFKPHGKFVQGEVAALTDKSATLKDGTVIDFDFCVIATGSNYHVYKSAGATTLEARKAEIQALYESVKAASSVLVIGGGPTGVEVAGEIITDFPDKKVTLVQSPDRLVPEYSPKMGAAAKKWFEKKGVKVILGDRVDASTISDGVAKTQKGVEVQAGLVLRCTGVMLNSGFMKASLPDAVNEKGEVKVDSCLRVVGHPTLFAIGDIHDVPQAKLAFMAAEEGKYLAKNLKLLATGGADAKLVPWKNNNGMPTMGIISVGRSYGLMQLGWFVLPAFIPAYLKGPKGMMSLADMHLKALVAPPAKA